MPYFPLGTLQSAIHGNPPFRRLKEWIPDARVDREYVAARVAQDVSLAMDFLHCSGVAHRDLKSDTILIRIGADMLGCCGKFHAPK